MVRSGKNPARKGTTPGRLAPVLVVAAFSAVAVGQTPGFYPIVESGGTNQSWIFALTADGSIGVGHINRVNPQPRLESAVIWTPTSGTYLPQVPGLQRYCVFSGVSADRTVFSGNMGERDDEADRRAFIVQPNQPLQILPLLANHPRTYGGVFLSADGLVVAGTCQRNGTPRPTRAFRWTVAGGITALPLPRVGDSIMNVQAISRDGSTIVGYSANVGTGTVVAFKWRAATGSVVLPTPRIGLAQGNAVSDDGSIVVGVYSSESGLRPVFWDLQLQLHDLGSINGSTSNEARCVSGDGHTIGGFVAADDDAPWQGFIWTSETGMRLADEYLAERSVTLPAGHRVAVCEAMSGDGRTISCRYWQPGGTANHAALVVLPRSCPADFNNDGGIDGADIEAFFVPWESGEQAADVNADGGVDGGDVAYFFGLWESGGC